MTNKESSILSPAAVHLIKSKIGQENQLVFGGLLTFFQSTGRFPHAGDACPVTLIQGVAECLAMKNVIAQEIHKHCVSDKTRSIKRFKKDIRSFCLFRESTKADQLSFIDHCKSIIFPEAPTEEQALEQAYAYLKSQKIEPYSEKQLNRLLTTAHNQFESEFFLKIDRCLSPETKQALDQLLPSLESELNTDAESPIESDTKSGASSNTPSGVIPGAIPEKTKLVNDETTITLHPLKSEQVDLKINSILYEIQKYKHLHSLNISSDIHSLGTRKLFCKYYERVLAERPSSLLRYKQTIRTSYLALFCLIRHQIMTDTLTDLLLKLLNRILKKAERFVDTALRQDNKRIQGKMGTLLILAKKSIDHPEGIIQDIIYPTVSKDRLNEIVSDLGDDGQWYRNLIKAKALSLYSHNNRRIVWALMEVLKFQTDDSGLSKIIKALDFIKGLKETNDPLETQERNRATKNKRKRDAKASAAKPQETTECGISTEETKSQVLDIQAINAHEVHAQAVQEVTAQGNTAQGNTQDPITQATPNTPKASLKDRLYDPVLLKRCISTHWQPFVRIKTNHPKKITINWNACELALFDRLESALSVKNIWVDKAYRYRNPENDMPADFEGREDYYLALLGLPKDPDVFIATLKGRLDHSLFDLNASILDNPKVIIKDRQKKGSLKITPFDPQTEPKNLGLLKLDIAQRWPHLHLIDVLKEADLRIGFTKRFQSVASREAIPEEVLRKRLLLCVFGIGSNIGLKRMSGLDTNPNTHQEGYDDLRYVKRRFFTCQNVRFAIQDVVNAILTLRDPKIWGEGTTSCAADSKKISVWDQNLLVEWHARYGGRGIMIYWHVDKKGLCIHSKLKTCSSSEVGSMIHGILYHDTLMNLDKLSVDTHGQSVIGFAFSEVFQFDLLPRIKAINKQKLYCSSKARKALYPNLTDALASETIQWSKIKQHYKEIVRHAAALKCRTVEPDVMMRRLSADNKSNPVYQALTEIGKASRTIFLCNYLQSEALRIDINEALNVVERVNGLMEFISYGRLGEISTNTESDQELSLLCLHLLQVCMVYVNTILIQTALSDPKWAAILTSEDRRALSPLFHAHINPYGLLSLDMDVRLDIDALYPVIVYPAAARQIKSNQLKSNQAKSNHIKHVVPKRHDTNV